jgi:hypothetical protein
MRSAWIYYCLANVGDHLYIFESWNTANRMFAVNTRLHHICGNLPRLYHSKFCQSSCTVDKKIYLITLDAGELYYFDTMRLNYVNCQF